MPDTPEYLTFEDADGIHCGQPCCDGNAPELAEEQGIEFIPCNNLVLSPGDVCTRHLMIR